MRYVDEFRDRKLSDALCARIKEAAGGRSYNIMEVCGTHTMNISRFGIRKILPGGIRLISGPGCPVCVTPVEFIDRAIALCGANNITVATFGDMFRVPGSRSSLIEERSKGKTIKIVYSPMDALDMAKRDRKREVVFLGVGFETTAPAVATSILKAKEENVGNYSVLCGHKTIPRPLESIVNDEEAGIDAFLLPAHVSAIIGSRPYEFLAKEYAKRCAITGFEPLDILQGILMLISQKRPAVEIQYSRVVKKDGNKKAQDIIGRIFEPCASSWRGFGVIKESGLKIRKGYSNFDAQLKFGPRAAAPKERKGCICAAVLRGAKTPLDCGLFGGSCKPESPVGPCMVSSEGTCSAYYKYERAGWRG